MKVFFRNFIACLLLVEVFLGFGGWMLFDFSRHFFLAGGTVAFALTVLLHIWMWQMDQLESLEKRVKELEKQLEEQKEKPI